MLTIYKSLIRQGLEYCSPLWLPTDQKNINAIEKVQRSFTKRIAGLQGLNYRERLHKLHLYSMERRRERYAILYIWKSWYNLVPWLGFTVQSFDESGLFFALPQLPQGPGTAHIRKLKENSIFYQGVRLFNSLPGHLRMATNKKNSESSIQSNESAPGETSEDTPLTKLQYKDALDSYLQTIPDQPAIPEVPRLGETNSIRHQKLFATKPKHNTPYRRKRRAGNALDDGPPPKKQ